MAWPLVAMAGMSIAGGMANKRAAKRANRKNRKQAEQDRRLEYQLWQEGNSLFGPYSMGDPSLNSFELSRLSDAALIAKARKHGITPQYTRQRIKVAKGGLGGMFGGTKKKWVNSLNRSELEAELRQAAGRPDRDMFRNQLKLYDDAQPYAQIDKYSDIPTMYEGLRRGSDETAEGIFDDSLTDRRISFYQPVFDARQGLVDAQKQGAEEALQDTLGNLAAKNRRKGYSGDSLAGMQLEGRARKATATGTGKMQKIAELQNATDVLNQRIKGQELKINNLGLPGAQAAREAKMRMIPLVASTDASLEAQKGLNFFKMRQGAPQLSSLPQYQQLPTNTELLMKAGSTLAGGIMQQNAQDSYMANMKDIAKIKYASQTPTSQQSWTPAGPGGFGGP